MHKLTGLILATGLVLAPSVSVLAQGATALSSVTGPTEVGNTSMPAGQYLVIDQHSHKSYSLMVTQKGSMILGPAPDSAKADAGQTTAAAAAPAAGAAAATTAKIPSAAVKSLMQQGMSKGMNELMKRGGTNQLNKLIK